MIKRTVEIIDEPSFFHEIYEFGTEENSTKIMITAGIHGDEVTGIYVAEKLVDYFYNNVPQNAFIKIMPRCNPAATRQMKRRAFYDDLDMNRIFPGDEDTSTTMRAAHSIWQESENMDIIIDLHCCSQTSMMYALALHEEFPLVKRLIEGLSIQNLVQSEGVRGQFFVESCHRRKQKAFIIELPSGIVPGAINFKAAEECISAVLNLLKTEGVLEGNYVNKPPKLYGKIKDVMTTEKGIWLPRVENGQLINKGDVVGCVNNTDVLAPETGKVFITAPGAYVFVGDNILSYVMY